MFDSMRKIVCGSVGNGNEIVFNCSSMFDTTVWYKIYSLKVENVVTIIRRSFYYRRFFLFQLNDTKNDETIKHTSILE